MTVSFVQAYLPYLFTALVIIAALFACGFYRLGAMEEKNHFYDFALDEINAALSAADRVLSDKQTPPVIRQALLAMLNTLGDEKLRTAFMRKFSSFMDSHADRPGSENAWAKAIEDLRVYDYQLATDAHAALMGIALLAIPLAQDSRADVLPYVSKAASNPGMVFARMGKAAPRLREENSLGGAVALTY